MDKRNASGLVALMNRAMSVDDILSDPLVVIRSDTTNEQAVSLMQARGFDMVGVDATGDGRADSCVTLLQLASGDAPWKCAQPLLASMAVEKSMPLVRLMSLLRTRPEVFVLDGDHIEYIATRADLSRPQVSPLVLAHLLALEQALLQMAIQSIGSNWFEALPAARRDAAMKIYRKNRKRKAELGLEDCLYFDDVMALASIAPGLLKDIGTSQRRFQAVRERFAVLRNDLAHGGTILDRMSPDMALETFAELCRLTGEAEARASRAGDFWSSYAAAHVLDADRNVLVGPGAAESLPVTGPAMVLTAWNPGSRTLPDEDNIASQQLLAAELAQGGFPALPVVGTSPDGRWSEPSLLLSDVSRGEVIEVANRYGQAAIFEIDDEWVRVISVPGGGVRTERPRNHRS